MHPLYPHSLNSVYQYLPPFNLYQPIGLLVMTTSFLLQDEKFDSRGGSPAWHKWGSEGEKGLGYRDIGSILSAPCAQRACRIITAEVLTAWSWDQQQCHLETC